MKDQEFKEGTWQRGRVNEGKKEEALVRISAPAEKQGTAYALTVDMGSLR